ncbi:MAG TPA: S8 family serine peptidase [Woeseiaceae bacterium]|jgi:uncharacterized repeat protein (TIGR01451 family)|nr:S8 family serine peptidase [Woeseiaceae bacterium]
MKKYCASFAAAAAMLAVLFTDPVAHAADLELAADQPKPTGILGSNTEEHRKASYERGDKSVYIVRLSDPAMAAYDGGIAGLAATSNRMTGKRRLDVNTDASKAYQQHLRAAQDRFVADCEAALGHGIDVRRQYKNVFNGVAMVLSDAEAKQIAAVPGVLSIEKERFQVLNTDDGPVHIGAPAIWNAVGGSRGEGVVVGILDSGINHDHPSFADIGGDGYDHVNPLGAGNYIPGSYCDVVDPGFCNDKLIGAWDMVMSASDAGSPEDSDGHGSHTASTAAGNVIPGAALLAPTTTLVRDISGVAPHANIIAYDVCIVSCPGSALLAAIDQIVIDASVLPNGIAVFNYSISGGNDPYNDAIEIAFLNATAAGIYVATSAGNAGPGPATTGHNSPWAANTAAMTHRRALPNSVIGLTSDGSGLADIEGLGLTSGYGPASIVYAGDFPTANGSANDTDPAQCLEPFPAGHFSGEIVVCDRGTIARVDKGANVLAGGAGGLVLANVDAQGESIVGDAHFLPGVHIGDAAGDVLRDWLATNLNTMASISGFSVDIDAANADIVAGFSSRGPNAAIDVLKPDMAAPGVSVLAALATDGVTPSPEYGFLSGTSMASPHHAGSVALIRALHPDWTIAEIRSALMTTANNDTVLKEDGMTPADPFDVGAGRIDLNQAPNAGLVLDETVTNFINADPALGGDPSTLNLASMAKANCTGHCSWTRELKNVTGSAARWRISTSGPAGLEISTSPRRSLSLGPGETGTLTVTVDTHLAPDGWNFAEVYLEPTHGGPHQHIPIAVEAVRSSNPVLLTKIVDAETAAPGEPVNYTIEITNGNLSGLIDVVDVLPRGVRYVRGSAAETIVNGSTTSSFGPAGRGTLAWSGMLDSGGLDLTASPSPFGYLPLASFGVAPLGCPSNCDDGGFIFTGLPAFDYNGNTYTDFIMSVNGTIEPGSASLLATSASNLDMPDATPPNNLLAPFWTDLNLTSTGNWYLAVLSDGVNDYLIAEWENVPLFSDPTASHSFQVWIQAGSSNIWFVYGGINNAGGIPLTVGIEDAAGAVGASYFFNGAGTSPAVGTDLQVQELVGGTATLTFQGTVRRCSRGEALVNVVTVTDGAGAQEEANAVTECVR